MSKLKHLLVWFASIILLTYVKRVLCGSSQSFTFNSSYCPEKISNKSLVEHISLYGNGIVALGVHHTLIVLFYNTTKKYRLLETIGHNGIITINDQIGESEIEVLKRRSQLQHRVDRWGENTYVNCSDTTIAQVINTYQCAKYKPFHLSPKNCRTFVNDIFRECGSSRRTGKNPFIE